MSVTHPLVYTPVEYPDSDGRPIAETDWHSSELMDLVFRLKARYGAAPNVYVTSSMFVYYEEGNPHSVLAPDVMVVFGVPNRQRRVYFLWEEGEPPSVVFELSSRATWREDQRNKKALCARLGVSEFYLYDPAYEYLRPPLQGFRLVGDTYVPITPAADGSLHSERLGLALALQEGRIRLTDLATGEHLPTSSEVQTRLADAQSENARLRAELELRTRGVGDRR